MIGDVMYGVFLKKSWMLDVALVAMFLSCVPITSYAGEVPTGDPKNSWEAYMSTFPTNENGQYVDGNGDVLDWDFSSGFGNEDMDGIGTEEGKKPEETFPPSNETMSFSEAVNQQQIVESIKQSIANDLPKDQGYVTVYYMDDEEENWSRDNIKVVFWRNRNQKEEVFLYRQNRFYTSTTLPVGQYTFGEANSIDGEKEFSTNMNSFTVDKYNPVDIELFPGKTVPKVTVAEGLETVEYVKEKKKMVENKEKKKKNIGNTALIILCCIIGFVTIGGFSYFLQQRRLMEEDDS